MRHRIAVVIIHLTNMKDMKENLIYNYYIKPPYTKPVCLRKRRMKRGKIFATSETITHLSTLSYKDGTIKFFQ